MRQITLTIIILLFPILMSHSQEATDEPDTGWDIIERCVGEPITPPDDWTFAGTILATGWAGIHGINADWDTPHILAFNSDWVSGGGADLSPNRRWMVVVLGYDNPANNANPFTFDVSAYAIQVYDLSDRNNQIQIPIDLEYRVFGSTGNGAAYHTVAPRWLDNEHFIYRIDGEVVRINPFTQEISDWDVDWNIEGINPLESSSILFPSPDWTRLVYDVEIGQRFDLFDVETGDIIATVAEQSDWRIGVLPIWRADSSEFIMEDENHLQIFDRDGQFMEIIAPSNYVHFFQSWSPNEHYFVLSDITDNHILHIADFEERFIYNTCIQIDGWSRLAWNMASTQFVFYSDLTSDMLSVFDIDQWEIYETRFEHAGTLIGWREDES